MTSQQSRIVNLRSTFQIDPKKDQSKLRALQKGHAQLKEIVLQQDGQLMNQEINQLKNYLEGTNKLISKIQGQKNKTKETIQGLEKEVADLIKKIKDYDRSMNDDNKENADYGQIQKLKRQYMKICQERIAQAKGLTIKELTKLDLDDRKSIANEPFKWIMVAIYSEPQSKYYWPNFLQEALENDKGADMIERLGKVSAIKAKEQQRIKTQWFLANYEKITMQPQLKKVNEQMSIIRNIAKLYLESYDIGKKIAGIQSKIVHQKQKLIQKDDQFMRWKARSAALQDRVDLNRQYYDVLDKAWKKLNEKSLKYQQKTKQIEDFCDDLVLTGKSNFTPIINVGKQVGSGCNCMF